MTNYAMESYSIEKAKQLVINKHVDDCKKDMRAGKRMFSDLAMIKAPEHWNHCHQNWHIVVDQYTGYKESYFYCIKSDFVDPMCKNI